MLAVLALPRDGGERERAQLLHKGRVLEVREALLGDACSELGVGAEPARLGRSASALWIADDLSEDAQEPQSEVEKPESAALAPQAAVSKQFVHKMCEAGIAACLRAPATSSTY